MLTEMLKMLQVGLAAIGFMFTMWMVAMAVEPYGKEFRAEIARRWRNRRAWGLIGKEDGYGVVPGRGKGSGEAMSAAMERAAALAAEKGLLTRQLGGFWTPPGEPMKGEGVMHRPAGGQSRYAGTPTVEALRRRGVLGGTGWYNAPLLPGRGERGVALCEKCQEKETTSKTARFCAECRREGQSENGRRNGKRNSARGIGRIHVASREERDGS